MISAFRIWHGQPTHLNRWDFETVSGRCSNRVSWILLPQVLTLLPSVCSIPTCAVLWGLGMVRSKTSGIPPGVWCFRHGRAALGCIRLLKLYWFAETGLGDTWIYSSDWKTGWCAANNNAFSPDPRYKNIWLIVPRYATRQSNMTPKNRCKSAILFWKSFKRLKI